MLPEGVLSVHPAACRGGGILVLIDLHRTACGHLQSCFYIVSGFFLIKFYRIRDDAGKGRQRRITLQTVFIVTGRCRLIYIASDKGLEI